MIKLTGKGLFAATALSMAVSAYAQSNQRVWPNHKLWRRILKVPLVSMLPLFR